LKFSTGGDYFNARSAGFEDMNQRTGGICKKKRLLQNGVRPPSLETALHIAPATPTRANQTRGNKNGKEDFEEGKEDRSNQASGEARRRQVSADCDARHLTLFQERGVRALQSFSLEKG
jgi:hypothetical protein